jgi:hypothetical protein
MPQATNQSAIRSRSSVNVVHARTGCSSRSGGTAMKSRRPRCRYQRRLAPTLVGLPGTCLSVFAFAFADSSACLFACAVCWAHCSPLCSRQRPSHVDDGILLNGINLIDSSGCNHWITHGTWDHARTRALTTAPLIQRPTSAACSSSSLPRGAASLQVPSSYYPAARALRSYWPSRVPVLSDIQVIDSILWRVLR